MSVARSLGVVYVQLSRLRKPFGSVTLEHRRAFKIEHQLKRETESRCEDI